MLGAIAGDIIGSVYEPWGIKTKDFPLFVPDSGFSDDTVMTLAIADHLLHGVDLVDTLKAWYRRYPHSGYGKIFAKWAAHPTDRDPYDSWGNGGAMRTSPVAWAYDTLDRVLIEAERCSAVTHSHPEGIAGARAVAGAIFLARTGASKEAILQFARHQGYRMNQTLDEIRPGYGFDVSAINSVPQAITAFLESTSVEDAIRNAVSLGGDSDTQACIAGAIAEAFYGGVCADLRDAVLFMLPPDMVSVLTEGISRWGIPLLDRSST